MSGHDPACWRIVPAAVTDVEAMAALYCETYPSALGLPPGTGYPFPQYMSSNWLARSLAGGEFCWLVGKYGEEVTGCLGAAANIGPPGGDDRVAELTGLVVSRRWRKLGVGQALLKAMCGELEGAGAVILLAETRTGNLGGCKGTVKAGFVPIGFEPFAHNMVGHPEHMIMMGKVLPAACESRTLHYRTSPAAQRLGSVSLRLLRQSVPPSQSAPAYPLEFADQPSDHLVFTRLTTDFGGPGSLDSCRGPLIVEGVTWNSYQPYDGVSPGRRGHTSGIVGLRRIRGLNLWGQRFLDRYYVMRQRDDLLGIAQVSVDLEDSRVRVLRLEVQFDGLQAFFLRRVLEHLQSEEPLQQLACTVVDVRADFPRLHASLQAMGFSPTVYYPAFVATESGRVDAVQFTRICSGNVRDLPESLFELSPEITDIIRVVVNSRNRLSSSATAGGLPAFQ